MHRIFHDLKRLALPSENEKRRGRIIRAETLMTAGILDDAHTMTCIVVRLEGSDQERPLAFRCDALDTADYLFVRNGDEVALSASDFSGRSTTATSLSILWPQPVKVLAPGAQFTESGTVTRVGKAILTDCGTYTSVVVAAVELTDRDGQQHTVIFKGTADEHLHLAFIDVGQRVEVTYRARDARTGAEVTLVKLNVDMTTIS